MMRIRKNRTNPAALCWLYHGRYSHAAEDVVLSVATRRTRRHQHCVVVFVEVWVGAIL